MKDIINALNGLPKILKIILAIPMLDIVWVVYRLLCSIEKKKTLGIVLAIVLIFVGIPFLWLVDIICIALNDKGWWID